MNGVDIADDGWIRVVKNRISGFVDPSGKQVIDFKFRCDNFQGDRALVNVDGKFGFIDRAGNIVIDPIYTNAGGFFEGLACVQKGGKYGWIDTDGRMVIPFEYVGGVHFADGRAFVWVDGSGGVYCIDALARGRK